MFSFVKNVTRLYGLTNYVQWKKSKVSRLNVFSGKFFTIREISQRSTNAHDKIYLILSGTVSHPVSFTFFLYTYVQFRQYFLDILFLMKRKVSQFINYAQFLLNSLFLLLLAIC